MKRELKLRINNPQATKDRLITFGAKKGRKDREVYIYFNQSDGRVLKLTKSNAGNFKVVLKKAGNNFEIIKNEPVDDYSNTLAALTEQFGIHKKLTNKREFFKFQQYSISINQIDSLGAFVIIEGEEPSVSLATKLLGDAELSIITDSFDRLK